jgi:hypothetical protein
MIPDTSDDDAVWRHHLSLYPRRPRWMSEPEDVVRRVGETLYRPDWPDRMGAYLSIRRACRCLATSLREWHRRTGLTKIDPFSTAPQGSF